MAIRNIIFDLGGVLLDIDLHHCMRQMQALGIDLDALKKQNLASASSENSCNAVMGEGLVATGATHLYQIGGISTEEFLGGIRHLCRPGTTPQQVLEAWNTCCIAIPQYRLDKIKELKARGYRIYMLSNTNEAHWLKIVEKCFGGQAVVDELFDHTFLSQEMHMAKPNDDIYLKVLEDIGTSANECLFLDDSSQNVEAAAALGFHTIHADTSKTQNGMVVAPPSTDWTTTIDSFL